jgi:hypothetical protein
MKKLFLSFLTSLIILFSLATYSQIYALPGVPDPTQPTPTIVPYNAGLWCDPWTGTLNTAVGCLPIFDQTSFLSTLLVWAVGIGGGIAFLLIIYAGFMIMTASGNPERLKAGQELITSAISGLILLIFSIFILKFIGVDILGLCKFGFGEPCP